MQSPVMWMIITGLLGGFAIMLSGSLGAGALVALLSCLVALGLNALGILDR